MLLLNMEIKTCEWSQKVEGDFFLKNWNWWVGEEWDKRLHYKLLALFDFLNHLYLLFLLKINFNLKKKKEQREMI